MPSYTVSYLRRFSGDISGEATVTLTGDGKSELNPQVAVASPNTRVTTSIRAAGLKMILIKSDKAITLYANDLSSGAPDFNIAVTAGGSFGWSSSDGSDNPVTDDVADWYITATGSGTANVTIQVLQDATP